MAVEETLASYTLNLINHEGMLSDDFDNTDDIPSSSGAYTGRRTPVSPYLTPDVFLKVRNDAKGFYA